MARKKEIEGVAQIVATEALEQRSCLRLWVEELISVIAKGGKEEFVMLLMSQTRDLGARIEQRFVRGLVCGLWPGRRGSGSSG
jgi:hypothetical protein